jgi:hypothetical protein
MKAQWVWRMFKGILKPFFVDWLQNRVLHIPNERVSQVAFMANVTVEKWREDIEPALAHYVASELERL